MDSNTEAIFREFPFLAKFFSKERVQRARVERIDEELITRQPTTQARWAKDVFEDILLLDRDGDLIVVVSQRVIRRPAWRFFRWSCSARVFWILDNPRETVWEAIRRATLPVGYIVTAIDGQHLVLYKPPKNFQNAGEWMEEQVRRAQAAIQTKLNAIDAEGVLRD